MSNHLKGISDEGLGSMKCCLVLMPKNYAFSPVYSGVNNIKFYDLKKQGVT